MQDTEPLTPPEGTGYDPGCRARWRLTPDGLLPVHGTRHLADRVCPWSGKEPQPDPNHHLCPNCEGAGEVSVAYDACCNSWDTQPCRVCDEYGAVTTTIMIAWRNGEFTYAP